MFKFRIYVAGDPLNSTQALSNLAALCLHTCQTGTRSQSWTCLRTRSVRWRMAFS